MLVFLDIHFYKLLFYVEKEDSTEQLAADLPY